jgi:hypothetical protein
MATEQRVVVDYPTMGEASSVVGRRCAWTRLHHVQVLLDELNEGRRGRLVQSGREQLARQDQ